MLCTTPVLVSVRLAVGTMTITQVVPGPEKAAYKTHGHRNGSPEWTGDAHSLLCCSACCSGNLFGTTQEFSPFPVDKRTQWKTVSEQKWPPSPESYQGLPHSTNEAQWLGGSPALPTPVQLLRRLSSVGWLPRIVHMYWMYVHTIKVLPLSSQLKTNRLVYRCV